jgi:hypothetical protein
MNQLFKHNDIRFYVRALFEMSGIDIRYMAPDFDSVPQASPEIIEQVLEQEDKENADHMETHWLYYDRAREAIGMRESSGYSNSSSNEAWRSERESKKKPSNAYIGLARTNANRTKEHLNELPLGFEMQGENPQDGPAIQGVNRYRDEILNSNNWEAQKTMFIADGHDFGSGILYNPYKPTRTGRTDRWFMEERARQGQPIEFDEFAKMQDLTRSHVIKHIDTFDVIRDRRAYGEHSWDFSDPMHTITTVMEAISVTEAMQKFPKFKDRITSGISSVHQQVNPSAGFLYSDDLMITKRNTFIQCPVKYMLEVPVHVGNNIIMPQKEVIERTVVIRVERLENIGVVAMHVDEYAHGELPLTMWQRRASKFHSYGIGAYKDMWAAEWAYNIAFNGKFNWFNRMAKGGGFYFKGLMGKKEINARTKEHAWIEIDPNSLPGNLRDQPISNMIYDTRPTAFPSVYDSLELSMEDKVNRTSGWHDVAGKPSGSSGRQQMILEQTAQQGMGPTVRNLEMAFLPLGDKLFSNIVQFDGERTIEFMHTDPVTQETEKVELNIPIGETEMYDPETGDYRLFAYEVRNSIKTLKWSTKVTTRSIVPSNPTEQRFFWLDTLNSVFPYTQSEEGLAFLEALNEKVYGGLFTQMIARLQEVFQRNAQTAQMQIEAEREKAAREDATEKEMKLVDAAQNKFRLEQKALSDLIKALAAFQKGDQEPLQTVLRDNPNLQTMI